MRTYAENFPGSFFTTIIYCQPTIMTFATGYANLRFRPYLKTMYSSVYTGDWNIVAAPTDDDFTNLPTSIHIVWSVIGF
jgi:hypothetical protein